MVNPLIILALMGFFVPPASTLASDSFTAEIPIAHAIVKLGEKQLKIAGLKSQEAIVKARLREAELVKNNPVALQRTLEEVEVEVQKVKDEAVKSDLVRRNVEVLTALKDKLPLAVTNKTKDCPKNASGYGVSILRGC